VVSVSVWARHLVGKLEMMTSAGEKERLAIYLQGRAGGRAPRDRSQVILSEAKQLIAAQLGTGPEVSLAPSAASRRTVCWLSGG
jgi:hypothetical protein